MAAPLWRESLYKSLGSRDAVWGLLAGCDMTMVTNNKPSAFLQYVLHEYGMEGSNPQPRALRGIGSFLCESKLQFVVEDTALPREIKNADWSGDGNGNKNGKWREERVKEAK